MKRPYLRVTPSSESLNPGDVPDTLASLHKLTRSDPKPLVSQVNPFDSQPPLRFEFVALSAGADEPVEFYYGADDHLDVFEQRLRSMYTPSYDIDRVEVDLTKRLLRPVEFPPAEFAERVADGRLYRDPMADTVSEGAAVSDGETVAVPDDQSISKNGPSELDGTSEDPETQTRLDGVDIAPPGSIDEDNQVTAINQPTETEDGRILARPPLTEVEPYGVQWWGAAARRKDWMTTLTGYTDLFDPDEGPSKARLSRGRRPLVHLIEQLVEAPLPLAFQAVFQRNPDWSRDARRRTGELLDGTDTLLHKILGFESQGSQRSTPGGTTTGYAGRRPSPSASHPDSMGVEESSRYDLIQANSPKRTFTANVRLLALPTGDVDRDDLERRLDALCSVFDLIDGRYYEIEGRRFRSQGFFSRFGERHTQSAFDRFRKRSITTGRKRPAITNRSETRPDLVLNGNELANFVLVPSTPELPGHQRHSIVDSAPEVISSRDPATGSQRLEEESDGADVDRVDASFPSIPDTLLHHDDEVDRILDVLEPLTRGEQADIILITGPPGSGKTSIATFTIDHFRKNESDIDGVYVNCWEDRSRFQVLYRILDQLESTMDIHRQSTPRDVLLERLREYGGPPCAVILDEVDQLDDMTLLYDLLNMPSFSLLLIANREEDLLDGLDDRLMSRLQGCERIHCQSYTDRQLIDLLHTWSDQELDALAVDESALTQVASSACGDARVAITTLRIAARHAGVGSKERITPDIVESALPEARQEIESKPIDHLTSHQQAVFDIIEEHGHIAPRDLYEIYRERVEEPKSNRTIRSYLKELERYDLVTADGATRNRVYHRL